MKCIFDVNKISFLSSFFAVIFSSFMITHFYFANVNLYAQKIVFYSVALLTLVYLYKKGLRISISKDILWCLAGYFLLIAVSCAVVILHRTMDFSFSYVLVHNVLDCLLLIVFVGISLYSNFEKSNPANLEFCFVKSYLLFIVLYVGFSVICVLIPEIKEFWQSMIVLPKSGNVAECLKSSGYYYRFGWNGWSGEQSSLSCTLGIIMSLWWIEKCRQKIFKLAVLPFFSMVMCLIGNIMYARTGFYCSIIVVMMYACLVLKNNGLLSSIKVLAILVIGLAAIVFFLKNNAVIYNNAFSPILSLITGKGTVLGSSLDNLVRKMIWWPEIDALLFGHGRYMVNQYSHYMSTDVGFMRGIYFWGLLPTLLSYLLTVCMMRKTFLGKGIFFLMFLFSFVIFEYKNTFWIIFFVFSFVLSLISCCNINDVK